MLSARREEAKTARGDSPPLKAHVMPFVSPSTHIPIVLPPHCCSVAALLAGVVVVLYGPTSQTNCDSNLLFKSCRHLDFSNASCRHDAYSCSLSVHHLAHASLASCCVDCIHGHTLVHDTNIMKSVILTAVASLIKYDISS